MRSRRTLSLAGLVTVALVGCTPGGAASPTSAPTQGATSAPTGGSTSAPSGATSGAPTGDVIRIGASLALTGDFAPDSNLVRDGYEFWMNKVNAEGGIDVGGTRHRIELVIRDDGSDREQAARLVEQLITQDDVDFLLAPWGSGNTNAVAPIAERYQHVMVAPLAASDEIWQQGFTHLFGIIPLGSSNMIPFIRLGDELGYTSVSVVTTEDVFPLLGAQGAKTEAEAVGMEIRLDETYPPGTVDIGQVITNMQEADADLVAAPVDAADAITFLRGIKERGYMPSMLAFSGATLIPDFLDNVGEDAEGLYGITYWSRDLPFEDQVFGDAEQYATDFEAEYDYSPIHDNVAASMAGYALQRAIEEAGSLEVAAVREAMLTLDEETVMGNMAFEDTGINTGISTYLVQIQDGEPVIVYPTEAAAAEPIHPTPGWDER